jgi:hypothetical protein
MSWKAWLSNATIGSGVEAGATIICQDEESKPGMPTSASGGISGAEPTRCAVETPSARSWPAAISGKVEVTSPNIRWTWPATTSLSAGGVAL